jgi:hypothetical protein
MATYLQLLLVAALQLAVVHADAAHYWLSTAFVTTCMQKMLALVGSPIN